MIVKTVTTVLLDNVKEADLIKEYHQKEGYNFISQDKTYSVFEMREDCMINFSSLSRDERYLIQVIKANTKAMAENYYRWYQLHVRPVSTEAAVVINEILNNKAE